MKAIVDVLLLVLGFACLLIGLIGAVLPLPGPPLSLLGILLIHWTKTYEFSSNTLWVLIILTVVITVLDYLIPALGLKKYGGSKAGMWGSMIGLILGMGLGPLGIFIGAFAGALLGELLVGKTSAQASKAAWGTFIGFLFGVVLKVALCVAMIWIAVAAVI